MLYYKPMSIFKETGFLLKRYYVEPKSTSKRIVKVPGILFEDDETAWSKDAKARFFLNDLVSVCKHGLSIEEMFFGYTSNYYFKFDDKGRCWLFPEITPIYSDNPWEGSWDMIPLYFKIRQEKHTEEESSIEAVIEGIIGKTALAKAFREDKKHNNSGPEYFRADSIPTNSVPVRFVDDPIRSNEDFLRAIDAGFGTCQPHPQRSVILKPIKKKR